MAVVALLIFLSEDGGFMPVVEAEGGNFHVIEVVTTAELAEA